MNWNNLPPLSPEDEVAARLDGIIDGMKQWDKDAAAALMAITCWAELPDKNKPEARDFLLATIRRLQYQAGLQALENVAMGYIKFKDRGVPMEYVVAKSGEIMDEQHRKYTEQLKKLTALIMSGLSAPQTSGQPQPPNPAAGQTP